MSKIFRVYGPLVEFHESDNSKAVKAEDAPQTSKKEGVFTLSPEILKKLNHPRWAPTWETKHELAFRAAAPFKHSDRGYFGDPSFDSLFKGTGATKKELTPKLGLEIKGLQLSQLTDRQKDDLALLIEQKGIAVFRGQDFKDLPFEDIKKWGRYFGPLHVHNNSGAPLGQPEFHVVLGYRDKGGKNPFFDEHTSFITWHSDVSYEVQPPGITALVNVQTGKGGDTQFVDTIEAYERLSPTIQHFLDGLQAVHSSRKQIEDGKAAGGIARKPIVESIHPVVRYHPVLKKKGLFVNGNGAYGGFTTKILGLKDEESDALLRFLLNHINGLLDAHIRGSWDDKTVAVWDNRRLVHTATSDIEPDSIRTAFRVTTIGERPVSNEKEFNEWTPEKEQDLIDHTPEYLNYTPAKFYEHFYKPQGK
ncbi:DEKNAAC100166 [Brettanomyces naardenensis]|uniref:DEKNAAC100166 n=1 Tax=Brettanomyces naardenensis TaxID=13370 RepID=A0A448YFY5_BRENA|nr:DEKNAAC100166 [Brettanomyces naardenensis]